MRHKIGFLCTYIPVEIIEAAGFIPVRIIPTRYSQNGSKFLDANFCSYVLSLMSEAINNEYKNIDGIIIANSCDGMRRLYDAWKRYINYPKFIHFLDIPFLKDKNYYYAELKRLKNHMEEHFKIKIKEENLSKAIHTTNKRRNIAIGLYEERAKGKIAKNFFQTIELLYNPTQPFEKNAKKILEEMKTTDKKKLLISGTILKTADLEEISNAFIVYDDTCTGGRFAQLQIEENEEPLKAIADAYINKVPCPRMINTEEKLSHILKIIEQLSIDGVILYTLKFCDTSLFTAPFLKDELRKRNVPVLSVDDWFRPLSSGALKTRIQAFIEMIDG